MIQTHSQDEKTVKPGELSGKRLKAYRVLMKATAARKISIRTAYRKLSEIYKTRKTRKKTLKLFDRSPEIPLNVENQKLVNTA